MDIATGENKWIEPITSQQSARWGDQYRAAGDRVGIKDISKCLIESIELIRLNRIDLK
ncbi:MULTISPECIES: hypothetical protein [unclassified Pseudomonas]|uniref:hypothetical protein n=1 Tax=unclassified Pseudomonas TaxID=196821 RepID=UPI0021C92E6A|nr:MULTISPECIES: hypothetical protein [unclassified Pseudomonas]MCU1734389.1 hypothetical protein [Pseudomonas sp. 20P_3.2_Bac4]MCU1743406.1 hypothetical protein [Pseudomonas sp. 20P_3.2_Bac5]